MNVAVVQRATRMQAADTGVQVERRPQSRGQVVLFAVGGSVGWVPYGALGTCQPSLTELAVIVQPNGRAAAGIACSESVVTLAFRLQATALHDLQRMQCGAGARYLRATDTCSHHAAGIVAATWGLLCPIARIAFFWGTWAARLQGASCSWQISAGLRAGRTGGGGDPWDSNATAYRYLETASLQAQLCYSLVYVRLCLAQLVP